MLAVKLKEYGPPENMYIGEVAKPELTPDGILVKIHATALNRADSLQRKGNYPPPIGASDILGLEMAGVVEEVGSEVTDWKKGDRVMALLSGGGYAQYVVIHSKMGMRIPDDMDFITAAAIPEAFLTAYQTLFTIGNLSPHQKVLIHAGASGVGTSAIQLCNIVEGAEVYVTAGSQNKIDECIKLGAKGGVNYKNGEWITEMKKITSGGVDIIIDCVGANYLNQDLQLLKLDGKLIIIGFLAGSILSANTDIAPILGKRLTIQGSTLRNRSLEYKIKLTKDFTTFTKGFLGNKLKPTIYKTVNWNEVSEAHHCMEKGDNIGKIVLKVE